MSELLVNQTDLGRVLGVTPRTVSRLQINGVLPRVGKKYSLTVCVPAFIEYVKHDREASGDLAAAKLKLTDAQRRAVERKNAIAEKRLIEVAHVEPALERIAVLIGSQLDGMGGRLAGELAGVSDPAVVRKVIFDECRRIRNLAARELEALAGARSHGEGARRAAGEDA